MLHLFMKSGSVIPAHSHRGMAETLYVIEGDFINEGKQYLPGASLHVRAGSMVRHTTKNGCTVLILWTDKSATQEANLSDFEIVKAA